MAKVIVSIKIMPESPEVDLSAVEVKVKEVLAKFEAAGEKIEQEPVAFGLIALNVAFLVDEEKGDTEPMEKELAAIEGVNSAEVQKVTRALG